MTIRNQLVTLLTTSMFLLAVFGCSDDKKSNDTPGLVDGDENSEVFEALTHGADESLEVAGEMLKGMFIGAMLIMGDTANPNAVVVRDAYPHFAMDDSSFISLTKTYRPGSTDWLIEFSLYGIAEDGDTLTLDYIDSLKFFHGNTAVQWPDSASLTRFTSGMSVVITENGAPTAKVAHGGIFGGHDWSVSGTPGAIAGGGDIVIDGSGYTDVEFSFPLGEESSGTAQDAQAGTCDGLFDFGLVVNDLALNLASLDDDGCPTSGSLNFAGDVDVACLSDQGDFSLEGGITLTMVAAGDSVFYYFRNATTEWVYRESCGEGSGKRAAHITSPVSRPSWMALPSNLKNR